MLDAQSLHQGEVKIPQQRRLILRSAQRHVTAVLEATARHEGRKIRIAVTTGITHARTEKDDGLVEERFPLCAFLFLQLFQKTCKTVDMSRFDRNQIADHCRIIAMVRQAVIAGTECLSVEGKDLAKSVKEE